MTQPQGYAGTPRLVAGRYEVLAELGRGGMGVVWRAQDRVIGRHVAMKELRLPDGLPQHERVVFEERVLREARTSGRLNDPAVVTVHDVVSEGGITYLVMELIEAPTLSELVAREGPLPAHRVAAIATQVLSALESAHAVGIVHRDVKPSNIMVLPSGRAKLTDFGIAQATDDPRLTTTGTLIGSPTYMSPERIREAASTPASDLWSLGATLFFAVEGRAPFERPTTAATMHAILAEVPYLTRCQGPLASVIMGLLIGSPEGRLTGAQVRGLLDLIPAQHNGLATGPTVPHVTGPQRTGLLPAQPQRRWKGKLIAAGIAVVLIIAAFVGGMLTSKSATTGTTLQRPAGIAQTLTYGTEGDIPVFNLNRGYCGSGALSTGRSFPSSLSCDQPHDIEVFASENPVDSSYKGAYPGRDALVRYAEGMCGVVFVSDTITGTNKANTLTFAAVIPAEKAWSATGDASPAHEVHCVVWNRDGSQLSHSLIAKSS